MPNLRRRFLLAFALVAIALVVATPLVAAPVGRQEPAAAAKPRPLASHPVPRRVPKPTLGDSGRRVARGRLRAGDVLVFSGLGHVGLYIGRGRMVHAPYSGRRVEIVTLSRSHYRSRLAGVRRFAKSSY
ncbi:MAG: C40 family peptidase [Actinobacteria bacterium]|nr:C40 family peptidase [Actinomycetota bacterium]